MGCDIHTHAERFNPGPMTWHHIPNLHPFEDRNYGTFAFLAGVRNYSGIPSISEPRGFPADASEPVREDFEGWSSDAHSASSLTVGELLAFDYDAECEDRRVTRQTGPRSWDGGCTCEPGEGKKQTYREFLGPWFFEALQGLQEAGADRIVFWFDN